MSLTGKRRRPEDGAEETKIKRSHRSAFPTPGFKAFGTVLNLASLVVALILLHSSSRGTILLLLVLTGLGLGVNIYSNQLRPLPDNISKRKKLTGITAAFGFVLLIALAASYLIGVG